MPIGHIPPQGNSHRGAISPQWRCDGNAAVRGGVAAVPNKPPPATDGGIRCPCPCPEPTPQFHLMEVR
jgi:hypothetical protein